MAEHFKIIEIKNYKDVYPDEKKLVNFVAMINKKSNFHDYINPIMNKIVININYFRKSRFKNG